MQALLQHCSGTRATVRVMLDHLQTAMHEQPARACCSSCTSSKQPPRQLLMPTRNA